MATTDDVRAVAASGPTTDIDAEWPAPGPGEWTLDRSHYPGGTTPISEWAMSTAMPAGMERVFTEIGAPIRSVDARFVNGFMYTRRRPLIAPDRPATTLPPTPVLRLAGRLHPEFRRRARTASTTLRDRPSLGIAAEWERRWRPQLTELNLALQAVDLDALDDASLDEHLGLLLDHVVVAAELHFWLHGHDLGPIALLLTRCDDWGIAGEQVVAALAGASPSTSRPAERLLRIRELVDAAGIVPTTLDEVRSVSPLAADLLDEHLTHHGRVLATGYDLTASTLIELPEVLVHSIRTASTRTTVNHEAIAATLRASVPDGDRAEFDQVLADARAVMDMRDDNGPLTVEWPMGLLRHTLLHAGRRLVARGVWTDHTLAIEVTADEARSLMRSSGEPGDDALTARREQRRALASLEPPVRLGTPEPEPPLDVLPDPLPDLVRMVQTAFHHLGMDGDDGTGGGEFRGVGVGDGHYVGTARVVSSADEAIDTLTPGEVLVVRATSPAFNVVLAIAGAVVTADGGAMSHAAVLARELGLPAVVGASGALSIPSGATVEVDAAAGRVAVIDTDAT